MRLLLDTHVLLWCLEENDALTQKAYDLLHSAEEIFVSAASLWEIIIKISVGKLEMKCSLDDLPHVISESGFKMLSIKPQHVLKLADLEAHHKDPFDRILIAQSSVEPLQLVSSDTVIAKYKGNIIKI